jgi:hypothetical protein
VLAWLGAQNLGVQVGAGSGRRGGGGDSGGKGPALGQGDSFRVGGRELVDV